MLKGRGYERLLTRLIGSSALQLVFRGKRDIKAKALRINSACDSVCFSVVPVAGLPVRTRRSDSGFGRGGARLGVSVRPGGLSSFRRPVVFRHLALLLRLICFVRYCLHGEAVVLATVLRPVRFSRTVGGGLLKARGHISLLGQEAEFKPGNRNSAQQVSPQVVLRHHSVFSSSSASPPPSL